MALKNSDGSIILSTEVDTSGIKTGLAKATSLAKMAAKSVSIFGAAAAAGIAAMTKMAVTAYANYEQLVGGVETLFKGSAKKLLDYANDAYMTAGVSANQYMETVTSFSAALISSLAGDTEKAAEVANMAMVDISDNANKMGTAIESVQYAYQSFARGQYMLLDNLKLGYGGTKKEMERLLRDAQKLTGTHYDISSLSDVYSAIHAIQEQLGIAGTTAKEAFETITGSANMTRAAWKNVLSSIAGGGDLDKAINNLVFSISKYMENIVPVVQRSLVGIGQLIEKVAPLIVQNVATALIRSIPSLVTAVYNMIVGLAQGIINGIKALFTGQTGTISAIKSSISDTAGAVGGVGAATTDAANAMDGLADSTKAAGKEAKKSLAAFDDLKILSSSDGGSAGSAGGSVGDLGLSAGGAEASFESLINTEGELSEANSFLVDRINELAGALSGLQAINLDPLRTSLMGLKDPIETLANIGWSAILWGLENVLVPLSKVVIETTLPNAINLVSTSLSSLGTIADTASPTIKDVFDKLVTPILVTSLTLLGDAFDAVGKQIDKATPAFSSIIDIISPYMSTAVSGLADVWDEFSLSLGSAIEQFGKSDIIVDTLSTIQSLLGPIVQQFSLYREIISYVFSKAVRLSLVKFKTEFAALGDGIGIVAAVMRGDLFDACSHLWNIIAESNVAMETESFNIFKDSIDKVGTAITNTADTFNSKVAEMLNNWKDSITNWWDNDVAPWFTLEKWENLFAKIGEAMANIIVGADGLVETWKKNLSDWWNNDVISWFTIEKWKAIFLKIGTAFSDAWNDQAGFVNSWKTMISNWWDNDVAPWFTLEKWESLGQNIADGIKAGFKGALENIRGLLNKTIDGLQSLINAGVRMINAFIDGYNKVADKTPGLKSIITISTVDLSRYKIPPLASGAVIPPNKPFLAMVGDQKNGTNVEAPATLIKQMVTEALNERGTVQKEEHYYLNESELMRVVYKLSKGGERLNGASLLGGVV